MTRLLILFQLGLFHQMTLVQGATNETQDSKREFTISRSVLRTIRVVKLGIQLPRVAATGRLQFDVLTSFPGRQTIIQTSFNLSDWTAISTNQPPTNSFTFTESSPATNSHRFYRVVLPTE
jgi:hypothetical protein